VAINYVEVDSSNIATWKQPIHDFASSVKLDNRCNAVAVAANNLSRTYPTLDALQEYADRNAFMAIAEEDGKVFGYIICVEDTKHGGSQCKWIAADGKSPTKIVDIYSNLATAAGDACGWVWGRVTNEAVRELLINNLGEAELGFPEDQEIVTYRKPT
jgi:hypothetical protein